MINGSAPSDPRGFLVRFLDGPLASRTVNVHGGWTWPLPNRLAVLMDLDETRSVMWDADNPSGTGLTLASLGSPNVVVYRKLRQSRLPRGGEHLARGAEYELDEPNDDRSVVAAHPYVEADCVEHEADAHSHAIAAHTPWAYRCALCGAWVVNGKVTQYA